MLRKTVAALLLILPTSGFTDPVGQCSNDTDAQTKSLRQRIEAMRASTKFSHAELAFAPLYTAHEGYASYDSLRFRSCVFTVENSADILALIDVVLGTKPVVGYPKSFGDYLPEAGWGIYFNANTPQELDLWFSNPMRSPTDPSFFVVGQSHDFSTATAYKISAAGTLRADLFNWVQDHGHPNRTGACTATDKTK